MERIKVNLATIHIKRGPGIVRYLWWFLFLLAIATGAYEVWRYKEVEKNIVLYKNNTDKQIKKQRLSVAPKKLFLDKEMKELASKIKLTNKIILGDYFQCSLLLDKLEAAIPNNLFLNEIDVDLKNEDDKKLKIGGYTQSFADIVLFVNNLENSDFFRSPFLLSQNEEKTLEGEKQLRFSIKTDILYPVP
jgi:hypothetical protein